MAISFDETNDYYTITDDASLSLQDGDWCVAIWTKVDDNTGSSRQYLISTDASVGANNSLNLWLYEDSHAKAGQWALRVADGDGTDPGTVDSGATAPGADSVWRLIVGQRRTADSEIQLWFCTFGGSASKVGSAADTSFNGVNPTDWIIAGRKDLDGSLFYGSTAAELFKGDFSLSQVEIEALAAGAPIYALGHSPDMYLPMWTAGATLVDLFGSNDASRSDSPTSVEHPPVRRLTGPIAGAAAGAPSVSVAGSLTPAGALTNLVKKIVSGTITPAGALTNSLLTFLSVAGALTPSGDVSNIATFRQTLAGSLTPAGAVSFVVYKNLAGSLTPSGDLATNSVTTIAAPVSVKNLMYIEQVKFTEPYGLQLVGGDDQRLATFLAQRGVKDGESLVEELRTTFHSKDRPIVTSSGTNVTDIVDNIYPSTAEGGLVPVGGVVFWPCDAGTIPLGWAVYTAAQGKFLVGEDSVDFICDADGGALTYDVSHTHGPGTLATDSDNHSHSSGTLSTNSDNHSHTSGTLATDSDNHSHTGGTLATDSDSHSHTLAQLGGGEDFNNIGATYNQDTESDNHSHTVNSGSTGSDSHSHSVTSGSTGSDSHSHSVNSGSTGSDSHSHSVTSGVTASGGSAVQSILPPYHVGTWIQFVGTV